MQISDSSALLSGFRFPDRQWVRRGERYFSKLTAIAFFFGGTIYFWSDSTSWLMPPWQIVLFAGLAYAVLYVYIDYRVSQNPDSRLSRIVGADALFYHACVGVIGVEVFALLHRMYLPESESFRSSWPLLIYPLMLISKSPQGVTQFSGTISAISAAVLAVLEYSRVPLAETVASFAWILTFAAIVHYFARQARFAEAQSSILNEIATELARLDQPRVAYQGIVDKIGQRLGFQVVHLLTLTEDNQGLELKAGYGRRPDIWKPVRIVLGQGVTGTVALHQRATKVDNTNICPYYLAPKGYEDIRSEICAPIMSDGLLFGVLDAESNKVNEFTEADLRTLKVLANALSVALAHERILQRVQAAIDETWDSLKEFDTTTEMFKWLADYIGKEMGADIVIFYSLSIGTGYPKQPPHLWPDVDDIDRGLGFYDRNALLDPEMRNFENAVTNMAVRWSTFFETNASGSPYLNPSSRPSSFIKREHIASTAFIPIGASDNKIGELFISFRQSRTFTLIEQSWLKAVVQAATPHLLRARHYWHVYEGLAMPELNIHGTVHKHELSMLASINDLRPLVSNLLQCGQYLDNLQQDVYHLRREVLLAASGAKPEFSKERLSEILRKSANTLERASRGQSRLNVIVQLRIESENPECKMFLYRIASEAMNNAVRYGHAPRCDVDISRERSQIVIEIRQYGEGFDPERAIAGPQGIFALLQFARDYFEARHEWLGEPGNKRGLRVTIPALPRIEELLL